MRPAAVNDLLGHQKFGRLHLKKILESQYIKPWGSFLLNGDKKKQDSTFGKHLEILLQG